MKTLGWSSRRLNDRGCAKWGRRIGRQSLKEGWYVRVYVLLVRVSHVYGWHDHVSVWLVHGSLYVSLYEDVCVVLVNVCICWVGTNELMFSLKDMSVFSVVSTCIV